MSDDPFFADPDVQRGAVAEEDVPREKGTGRYLLPDPQTGEIQPHSRVTTLASSLENNFIISRWTKRMIVRGMGLRADLMARAGAAHPDDEGYNKLLDSIGDAAFEAAGGSWGSNLGTAQHAVFKQHFFQGVPIEELPEYFQGDLRAVRAALDFHGIELVQEYIERVVRCSLYGRAGRIDAIGRLRDGTLVIVDLKTEKDPTQYPDGKTVQLAYYANSDQMMDYGTGKYEPMPAVHRDFALVVWCRPGSGQAQILSVPIDIGWVGARIAEQNRAWRSQKIVIAPYMSEANYAAVPSDISVTRDGQTFGSPAQPIPGGQEQVISDVIAPVPAHTAQAFPGQAPIQPTCPTCQQILCPTCQQCCSGQCPQTACQCQQVPGTETWVPQPAGPPAQPLMSSHPANGQGNYAQIAAVVDQALQSGQQLGPDQVAHLNQQAAALIEDSRSQTSGQTNVDTNQHPRQGSSGLPPAPPEPPGQPVVGPGTPHPIKAGIHAEQVPSERPPAPKSATKKLGPAEYMNDLISRSSEGIDEEAFWLEIKDELANLSKKELLQPLLRLLEPGIAEKALQRHREPLAEMVIERVKKQREIRARQAGGGTPMPQQPAAQAAPAAQQPADQVAQQPGWAQTGFGGPDGQVAAAPPAFAGSPNQPVDMTLGGMLAALASAPDESTLVMLYQQWVNLYGAQQWIEPLVSTYWTRHAQVTSPQPTSVG